jgi:hypothetical protein
MNMAPPLIIKPFSARSGVASKPSLSLTVPAGFKILGGGAVIDQVEPANFLTASYPIDTQTWFAAGKDHEVSAPAAITVIVLAIQDDDDLWDVRIVPAISGAVDHPKVTAYLPGDYVLTGGGAFADYHGAGNMLNASFPTQPLGNGDWYAWEAHSKDHQISDPTHLTAYVIGVRLRSAPENFLGVQNHVESTTVGPASDISASCPLPVTLPHYALTGGGAWDQYGQGAGNMLTANAPFGRLDEIPQFWFARGHDHFIASPAPLTVWAIGLTLLPDGVAGVARHRDRHKASY